MGEDMFVQKVMLASFTTLVVLMGVGLLAFAWLIL